jgi:hypothetical protein
MTTHPPIPLNGLQVNEFESQTVCYTLANLLKLLDGGTVPQAPFSTLLERSILQVHPYVKWATGADPYGSGS